MSAIEGDTNVAIGCVNAGDCDCDEKPKSVLRFIAIRKVYFAIVSQSLYFIFEVFFRVLSSKLIFYNYNF